MPDGYTFPDATVPKTDLVSSSDIGRGQHKDGVSNIEDEYVPLFKAAGAGQITMFVYGHIDYCDIFNKPRSTAFCFVYAPGAGEELPICDRFNGEIPHRSKCGPTH